MIVRNLAEARLTDRRVAVGNWESIRLVLADDGVGYSFHITTIFPGTNTPMEYRNHLETVYCIDGEGEVETVADGIIYPISPGTVYVLDQHDEHVLRARTAMTMACVFRPAVTGRETHDKTGAYPAPENA